MALELTELDIDDLREQAQQQGEQVYQTTEFGEQYNFPQQLGIGYERIIQLRGDLIISILSTRLWQPLTLKRQHEDTFPITAKFYLSGAFRVKTPQVPRLKQTTQN